MRALTVALAILAAIPIPARAITPVGIYGDWALFVLIDSEGRQDCQIMNGSGSKLMFLNYDGNTRDYSIILGTPLATTTTGYWSTLAGGKPEGTGKAQQSIGDTFSISLTTDSADLLAMDLSTAPYLNVGTRGTPPYTFENDGGERAAEWFLECVEGSQGN
jgi:hypothetical protein